jgi:outer membrane protein
MMKKSFLALSITLAASSASADVLGVHGKAAVWQMNYSGDVTDLDSGSRAVDFEDDFGFDDDTIGFAEIAFEHPVPLIPNFKLAYTGIDSDETNEITEEFVFDGETYSANTEIATDFKADMYDLTAYYEVLDNWVQADVGLTIRYLDANIDILDTTTNITSEEEFSTPVPYLYGAAQFDLPLTNVYGAVSVNFLTFDDITTYDVQASLGWMPLEFIGAEVGYRQFAIEADDIEDYDLDFTMSGPYIAAKVDF